MYMGLPRAVLKVHVESSFYFGAFLCIHLYSESFTSFHLLALANVEVDFLYVFTKGCQKFMMSALSSLASSYGAYSYGVEFHFANFACFNALAPLKVIVSIRVSTSCEDTDVCVTTPSTNPVHWCDSFVLN